MTPYHNAARMSGGTRGRAGDDKPKRPRAVLRPGWLPEGGRWALSPPKANRKGSSASTNPYE